MAKDKILLLSLPDCYCSVAKSCSMLCDPMNCSVPGFPVLHHLPEFAQTHVHWVSDTIQPSHPITLFSSCPQFFPESGSFPMSRLFTSGGQSIRASASASVLPVNIQGLFSLGLTGFISLPSKGLSRVFSSARVHTNLCPLSLWCHPTFSSSVAPFSSCPRSFPVSWSFPMSQLFASGGQSIGVSTSTSVLSMNTQNWFPLGWAGWISLPSKGLSRVFSNTTVQKHQFFSTQLAL